MNEEIYRVLTEQTKKFLFSGTSGTSDSILNEAERSVRLKELVTQARKMAIKKFYQMPLTFRSAYTRDDWIQEAMSIFCDLISTYIPEKGSFDHYLRFILSRRLISFQRSIFRQNPPVYEDLRKIAASWKREHGREASAEELSEFTGCGKEEAQIFLDGGLGHPRIRAEGNQIETRTKNLENEPFEDQYIQKEACGILWHCIEELEKKLRLLFIRHEFDGISFENLFKCFGKILKSKSVTTFQRAYKKRVFDPVRNCVQKKYKTKKSDVLKK